MSPEQVRTLARERLYRAFPAEPERVDRLSVALPTLTGLELVSEGLEPWWATGGNILLARPGAPVPHLHHDPSGPARGALLVLSGGYSGVVMVSGEAAMIVVGEGAALPNAWLHCGSDSTILIGDHTASNGSAEMDARNGGLIYVGPNGLWAPKIRLQTDDMHAVRDLSGKRVNRFGGVIVIERHVWLGQDVFVLGGARVGADSVLGARSLVKGQVDGNCVYGGVPARRLKTGVTWDFHDLP